MTAPVLPDTSRPAATPPTRPNRQELALVVAPSALTLLLVALPEVPVLRWVVVCTFWGLTVGAVLRRLVSPRAPRSPSVLDAAYGLAALGLLSQACVLVGLDRPRVVTAVVAVVCLASGLVPFGRRDLSAPRDFVAEPGDRWRPGRHDPASRHLAVLVAALVLWAVTLPWAAGRVDADGLGDLGLLPALPPTFYLALAAAVVATASALAAADARRRFVGRLGVAVVVVILYATTCVLYRLPKYSWTYKHLGVVDYIATRHALPRSADIYFDWPGFFTSAHWLSVGTGLDVTTLARWAPLVYQALLAAVVFRLVLVLGRDARVAGLAALAFACANWVGQDYFAPQPLALLLGLALLAELVPGDGDAAPRPGLGWRSWAAPLVLWVALVTTHQLTPVVLGLLLFGLRLAFRRPSWPLLITMGLIEVAWVALALPDLRRQGFSLFSLDPTANSRPPLLSYFTPSDGAQLRTVCVYVLFFAVFAAGVGYGLLQIRRHRTELLAALAAVVPALVLLVQDYGGEGRLRTYLFALPFLTFLIARAVLPRSHEVVRRRHRVLPVLVPLVVVALFLPAYLGQDRVLRMVPADVATMTYYYDHATPTAELVTVTANAPSRLNQNYLALAGVEGVQDLLDDDTYRRQPTAASAVAFLATRPAGVMLVMTPGQREYMAYFGIADEAESARMVADLDRSPRLRVVFSDGPDGRVWQLR